MRGGDLAAPLAPRGPSDPLGPTQTRAQYPSWDQGRGELVAKFHSVRALRQIIGGRYPVPRLYT